MIDPSKIDYIGITTNLGIAASQLIALSVAILTGLFTIRQQDIVIRKSTYTNIGVFLILCALTVLLWITISFAELLGMTSRSLPDRFQSTITTLALIMTVAYLAMLVSSVWELFAYVRRIENK